MRKTIALAAISWFALISVAQAEEWCRRGAGRTECHFSSLSQCQLSARFAGGQCERRSGGYQRAAERHAFGPAASTHASANYSRLRASYTRELGRITYTGKPACDY